MNRPLYVAPRPFKALMLSMTPLLLSGTAHAATLNGQSFTIGSNLPFPASLGNSLLSNTEAQVGSSLNIFGILDSRENRGLAEFDLTGAPAAGQAILTFRVDSLPLSLGNFDIGLESYAGNNAQDASDFQANTVVGNLASFDRASLTVGQIVSGFRHS